MIIKPLKMEMSKNCNRKLLQDRFYAKQKFLKDKPCLVSRRTPDIALWERRGWIIPVAEGEKPKPKKK